MRFGCSGAQVIWMSASNTEVPGSDVGSASNSSLPVMRVLGGSGADSSAWGFLSPWWETWPESLVLVFGEWINRGKITLFLHLSNKSRGGDGERRETQNGRKGESFFLFFSPFINFLSLPPLLVFFSSLLFFAYVAPFTVFPNYIFMRLKKNHMIIYNNNGDIQNKNILKYNFLIIMLFENHSSVS